MFCNMEIFPFVENIKAGKRIFGVSLEMYLFSNMFWNVSKLPYSENVSW